VNFNFYARRMTLVRIDKFAVPAPVLDLFLTRAAAAQEVLRGVPGFLGTDLVRLEHGDSDFNVVSMARWVDAAAAEGAAEVIRASQRESGFDPQAFRAEHGIRVDSGFYAPVTP